MVISRVVKLCVKRDSLNEDSVPKSWCSLLRFCNCKSGIGNQDRFSYLYKHYILYYILFKGKYIYIYIYKIEFVYRICLENIKLNLIRIFLVLSTMVTGNSFVVWLDAFF